MVRIAGSRPARAAAPRARSADSGSGAASDFDEPPAAIYDRIAQPFFNASLEPSEHLQEFLALLPLRGRILDVGCGSGADCHFAALRGFDVVGTDASRRLVALARRHFPQVVFRVADMRRLRFAPRSFDGIQALFSLIHVPKRDVPGVLASFARILKPRGSLFLGLQEGPSAETALPEPLSPAHRLFLNVMSVEEVERLLAQAGFRTLRRHVRDPFGSEFPFRKLYLICHRAGP